MKLNTYVIDFEENHKVNSPRKVKFLRINGNKNHKQIICDLYCSNGREKAYSLARKYFLHNDSNNFCLILSHNAISLYDNINELIKKELEIIDHDLLLLVHYDKTYDIKDSVKNGTGYILTKDGARKLEMHLPIKISRSENPLFAPSCKKFYEKKLLLSLKSLYYFVEQKVAKNYDFIFCSVIISGLICTLKKIISS